MFKSNTKLWEIDIDIGLIAEWIQHWFNGLHILMELFLNLYEVIKYCFLIGGYEYCRIYKEAFLLYL